MNWTAISFAGLPFARLAFAGTFLVGAIALYVAWGQYRHNYPPQFEWPLNFDRVRNVAWMAVVLLVVDVLVARVRRDPPDGSVTPPA